MNLGMLREQFKTFKKIDIFLLLNFHSRFNIDCFKVAFFKKIQCQTKCIHEAINANII